MAPKDCSSAKIFAPLDDTKMINHPSAEKSSPDQEKHQTRSLRNMVPSR
jgi:hypothetical protein